MSVAAVMREANILEVLVAALIRAAIAVCIGIIAFAFGYKEITLPLIEYLHRLDDRCRRELRRS